MSKLHLSWQMAALQKERDDTVAHFQQHVCQLLSEVQRLELLVALGASAGVQNTNAPTSEDVCCQLHAETIEIGTFTEGEFDQMVPMSKVEALLEKSVDKAIEQNEETTRTIMHELQRRHESELAQMRNEVKEAVEELKQFKDERNKEEIGEPEVCDWTSSSDVDSSVGSEDLLPGTAVKLVGLASRPELNGRRGILLKYVLEKERWQVDLGVDLGIKLINGRNVKATTEYNDQSYVSFYADPPNLHRNDLGLQCDEGGAVEWDRVLCTTELAEFLGLCDRGEFQCSSCGRDTTRMSGNFGYVHCETAAGAWEERHLLNMIADGPTTIRCLCCNCATIPCKFHARGICLRGSACAYMH